MQSYFNKISLIVVLFLFTTNVFSQSCEPYGTYIGENGSTETINSAQGFSGSAPLTVDFVANPVIDYPNGTHLEWHFFEQANRKNAFLVRYEQNTQYTFTTAGSFQICLYEILGSDTINIYDPITVSISESEIVFPNAFSPNGDGMNDVYKAKKGFKSIVEFRAIIFNRWGQKLFEWTDPNEGWDGTFNGKPVAQGVYFVNVKAKGADGRKFHIKKDVNLLRGYNETTTQMP